MTAGGEIKKLGGNSADTAVWHHGAPSDGWDVPVFDPSASSSYDTEALPPAPLLPTKPLPPGPWDIRSPREKARDEARSLWDQYQKLAAIPIEGRHFKDENGIQRIEFGDDAVMLLHVRLAHLKTVMSLARSSDDTELLQKARSKVFYDFDSLSQIYAGRGDRSALKGLKLEDYAMSMSLGEFKRAEKLKDEIVRQFLRGDPAGQNLFLATHAFKTNDFKQARIFFSAARDKIKAADSRDPRVEEIGEIIAHEIPRAEVEYDRFTRMARRLAWLDFVEKSSELHGAVEAAGAEGRQALIAEIRSLLLSGNPEITTYDDAVKEIERRSRQELSFQKKPATFGEMRAHGFQKGNDNPFYHTNLLGVARGDGYFNRIIEIDRSDPGRSLFKMVEMAQWARREGSYDLAEILLESVKKNSGGGEPIWHEANEILKSLKGEGFHISDRGRDLLIDVGVEAMLTIIAGATVGGLLARGAVALMKYGSLIAKARKYARVAGVLANPGVQWGVGIVASAQGLTGTSQLLNYVRGRPSEGYLATSAKDLAAMLSISAGGFAFGKGFSLGTRELKLMNRMVKFAATEDRAILTFGRPLKELSEAEKVYLTLTDSGKAIYRLGELTTQAHMMMGLQAAEASLKLCEGCPTNENLSHLTRLLATMRDFYLIHKGSQASGAIAEKAKDVYRRATSKELPSVVDQAADVARRMFGFKSADEMTAEALKSAYKAYARKHHADMGGDGGGDGLKVGQAVTLANILIKNMRGEALTAEDIRNLSDCIRDYKSGPQTAKAPDAQKPAAARTPLVLEAKEAPVIEIDSARKKSALAKRPPATAEEGVASEIRGSVANMIAGATAFLAGCDGTQLFRDHPFAAAIAGATALFGALGGRSIVRRIIDFIRPPHLPKDIETAPAGSAMSAEPLASPATGRVTDRVDEAIGGGAQAGEIAAEEMPRLDPAELEPPVAAAEPVAKVEVHHTPPAWLSRALESESKGAVDVEKYPPAMREPLRAFMNRAGALLQKMVVPEDGKGPIHLVVIEDANPNATYFVHDGQVVVGITLGLIETLESDDELAFIFGHEFEHAHSQLQKRVDALRWHEAFFLQRPVENEVDVRSVGRMLDKGGNPHEASSWLKRMRAKFGDMPGLTHPTHGSRVDTIDAAITANVRLRGQGREHRLNGAPKRTDVLGSIRQALFGRGQLQSALYQRAEELLNPVGIVDHYFEAVRDGNERAFPIEIETENHRRSQFRTEAIFAKCFIHRWGAIEALFPPSHGDANGDPKEKARRVDMQLRLARNLHDEFERARTEFLGGDFAPANRAQFEAAANLEMRSWPIAVPNLVGALKERDLLNGKKARLAGGVTPAGIKEELEWVEYRVEIAKAFFEPGKALDRFVVEGYKGYIDRESSFYLGYEHNVSSYLEMSRQYGLRIRYIHDRIASVHERVEQTDTDSRPRMALMAINLSDFMDAWHEIGFFSRVTADAKRAVWGKAQALLKQADPKSKEAEQLTSLLFQNLREFAGILPSETQRFAVQELGREIDGAADLLALDRVGSALLGNLAFLGEEKGRVVRAFQEKMVSACLEWVGSSDLRSALRKIAKIDGLVHGYDDTEISFEQYQTDAPLVGQFADRLRSAAIGAGLDEAQLATLIYVQIPSLMPASIGPAELARMRAQFIATCNDPKFKGLFTGLFGIYDTMFTFSESLASQGGEERAMRAELHRLRLTASRDWPESTHPFVPMRVRRGVLRRIDVLQLKLMAIRAKKIMGNCELIVATPHIWRLSGEENGDEFSWSYKLQFNDSSSFRAQVLERLARERPWDIRTASLMIRTRTEGSAQGEFLKAHFKWHMKVTGSVEGAAYGFWKSLGEAKINPGQSEEMDDVIASFYSEEVQDKDGEKRFVLSDPDIFIAYRRGVARFVEEAGLSDPRAQMWKRTSWGPVASFLNDATRYKKYPPQKIAGVLHDYVVERVEENKRTGFYVSDETAKTVDWLWSHRGDPAVERVLEHPYMVRAALHQSAQVRIAKWQLERIAGFKEFLPEYEAHGTEPPQKGAVRDVVRRTYEVLKMQFPEPTLTSHEVLQFAEERLLPNEVETALLAGLRPGEENWTETAGLAGVDVPDIVASRLRSDSERIDLIRYLIGASDKPPKLEWCNDDEVTSAKSFYVMSGEASRTLALSAVIGDGAGVIQSSVVYASARKIIMDGAADDKDLEAVFDTYMNALPAGERKLLLANALATFDPSRGGQTSFRRLLEAGGPLGAKAAQGLVTSGVVTGELREDLMHSFDAYLPPTRKQVFDHLKKIFGDAYDEIAGVGRILGAGSLNYVVEVFWKTEKGPRRVAVRIQKDYVEGLIQNEHQVWQAAVGKLKLSERPRTRRYGRLIGGLTQAALKSLAPGGAELDLAQERETFQRASGAYSQAVSAETGLSVAASKPVLGLQQKVQPKYQKIVSVYEYVDSTKLDRIPDADRRKAIAGQIVDAELAAFDSGTFDPDAHRGNWLADLEGGKLVRVDYAQLTTVEAAERARFKELFRLLLDPSARGQLQNYLMGNFATIFDVAAPPDNLDKALKYVFGQQEMARITNPMERLLFIQNQLELYFVDQGVAAEFRLRDSISSSLGLFLRLNMYRQYIGDLDYLVKLARFLGMNPATLALAQLRSSY
ncbi:MAG: M48 family metalloprotease [Pseudomonadota bacterium]